MEQSHWSRSAISGILGLAAVLAVYYTFPMQNYQPKGLLLPGKVTRSAIDPSKVKTLAESPLTAVPLGAVHLLLHIEADPGPDQEAMVLQKAQELAASVGANGLVIQSAGPVQSGPFRSLMYQASAVYVPEGGV
jgi:hypothetical protein